MTALTRRKLMKAAPAAAGVLAAPAVARAAPLKWRMVTSWPKRLPGPGVSAERVAERINTTSGGRLQVAVFAAGEVVPAFEVLDAVGSGVAEMGHTASFYWQGKQPAAVYFTTVPFGLVPSEHVAWVDAGGGQALWDELYAPFGVKPFMGGNTGVCMGGWFRHEIKSLEDVKGLKLRSLGLGGEIFRRLGATPQTTPPGEIFTSLQPGVIDGAEFVGPGSDIALGLYRVAPFYYGPGFNKPNGTGECLVALKAWQALEPFPPTLWNLQQYTDCFKSLGFDIRITEDISGQYKAQIVLGWDNLLQTVDIRKLPRAHQLTVLDEAERWVKTIIALDSGALKAYRFYALAGAARPQAAAKKKK